MSEGTAPGRSSDSQEDRGPGGTPGKKKGNDETGYFEAYASFARVLRTWLISFGIGTPILLLNNETAWAALQTAHSTRMVLGLFLAGVSAQVFIAILYKTAMWYLYLNEIGKLGKDSWLYQSADRLSGCYPLEVSFDILTVALFGWASWVAIAAVLPG